MVKMISIPYGTAHKGKNSLPLGADSFFKRSSYFEKGRNCGEALLDTVVSF